MKSITLLHLTVALLIAQQSISQDCKTHADLVDAPGKYLTAAQHPWPAARSGYFYYLSTAADKAMAKKTLEQIEKIDQKSQADFKLTGGNWESTFSSAGYEYAGSTKLGKYTFQAGYFEFFCRGEKSFRNSEYGTVLRIYVNAIPLNTLSKFLWRPFERGLTDFNSGLQYLDWKNHKSVNTHDQLIPLFTYLSCNSPALINAINTGENYFQDVDNKNMKPNTRYEIYRNWFVKKNNLPVLVPVSRKEYLQSLLEFYEREKLYFPKLIAKMTADRSSSVKNFTDWQKDVEDKIAVVKKTLSENDEDWLSVQAVVNPLEDNSQTYKAGLKEKLNYNRFWQFYDIGRRSDPLYKYNPDYFRTSTQGPARPQLISVVFRFNTIPTSLKLLDNFTRHFDFEAARKLVE